MVKLTPPFSADSPVGRTLIALRAGAMSNAALYERFPSHGTLNDLRKAGLVEQCEAGWQLTAAGRAACPLRNPAAATPARVPAVDQASRLARRAAASTASVRFPSKQPPSDRVLAAGFVTLSGDTDMAQKPKKRTAIDEVRDQLASAPEGLSRAELVKRTTLLKHNVDNAMYQMVRQGEAKRTAYGSIALVDTPVVAPKAAEEKAAIRAPDPEPIKAPASARAKVEQAPAIKFSIDSDGQLAIIDGKEILVLPPDATRRLGHFMGCFEPSFAAQPR